MKKDFRLLCRIISLYNLFTYVLSKSKADKEKQENFKKDFEILKKHLNSEVDHILFQDESMIRDYQAIQKKWFLKGHQRKISTYGKNVGVKLIETLNYSTEDVYREEHERYDAKVFLEFLKATLKQYPK